MKQSSCTETGALRISDTLAVHAWCENHDSAAAQWLREKYQPLVIRLASHRLPNRPSAELAASLTFERTLTLLETARRVPSIDSLLGGVVRQVCAQLQASPLLAA